MKKFSFTLLLFLGVYACAYGQTFGGGSGTKEDPYIISTPQHILELSNYVNSDVITYASRYDLRADRFTKTYGLYFEMTQDIDMDGVTSFEPIGYIDDTSIYTNNNRIRGIRCFAGHFDGKGHAIRNLKYEGELCNGGLFGRIMGATIDNLQLLDFQYTYTPIKKPTGFQPCWGGIVGSAEYLGNAANGDTTIFRCQSYLSNCETRGSIVVPQSPYLEMPYLGGIIGDGCYSIRNSRSFVSIIDTSNSHIIAGIGNSTGNYRLFHMFVENCVAYLNG